MPSKAQAMTSQSIELLTQRIAYLRSILSQTTDVISRRSIMCEISNLETNWAYALHPVR
jgi:hypothetical protein